MSVGSVTGAGVTGAADRHVAAVAKKEDAAVLQVAADDGADADPFAEATHAGTQGAHATDDQVDFDAGL